MKDDRLYLTPKELAGLGRVSVKTVYRWIRKGAVAAFKPEGSKNGSILIPKDRLRLDMLPRGFSDH